MTEEHRCCAYMFCGRHVEQLQGIYTDCNNMTTIQVCRQHIEEVRRRFRYSLLLKYMVLEFDDESDRRNLVVEKVVRIYTLSVRELFVVLNPQHLDPQLKLYLNEFKRHAETRFALMSLEKSRDVHERELLEIIRNV